MQALSCTKKHDHGSLKKVLDAILKGDLEDSIAKIHCSPIFNMRTVIVTRDSLRRMSGHGSSPSERYLDDLVRCTNSLLHYSKNSYIFYHT